MKKNEVKKLRLSRETLQILQGSDSQKVAGGVVIMGSAQSEPCCGPTRTGPDYC